MKAPQRSIDFDKMLARLDSIPVIGLTHACSQEMQEQSARAALKARGVKLRGDRTLICEAVRLEMVQRTAQRRRFDKLTMVVLATPVNGRPIQQSALRNILIYAHRLAQPGRLSEARKSTATFFGLRRGTRTVRTRHPSIEQVRRAEESIDDRFSLIQHADADRILSEGIGRARSVLDGYLAELRGEGDLAEFEAQVGELKLLCRLLDALHHSSRLKRTDRRAKAPVSRTVIKRELRRF